MRGSIALGLAALLGHALAIPTIEAYGAKFFTSDGNQFYIKGVAYQLTNDDPLADTTQCKLDFALMKTLGANAIRVYHADPTANHDICMGAAADAGIYLFVDLDTFASYIVAQTPTWNKMQYNMYARVMDAFQKYDNTAGFFIGNEVLTTGADSIAAPYVKAAAHDMKAYRDQKGYRNIPVGYSAADIGALRPNLQNYLACGSEASNAVDFFSLNAYEFCGSTTYEVSGYNMLQQNASNYNIPIFFSETGCNKPEPRLFQDQSDILGPEMDGTWAGAIIYEWIEETNDYGLISYGPSAAATATDAIAGYTRTGTPTPINPDFSNLSNQWATLNPTGVSKNAYSPSNSPPACPVFTSGLWLITGDVPLPTQGQNLNAQVSSSIVAGTSASGGAGAAKTSTAASGSSSVTGAAAAAKATSLASPGAQIAGMSAGLVGVMLVAICCL